MTKMMMSRKSVVFVAIVIVISGIFAATVDAVKGEFQLATLIIHKQIEFRICVCVGIKFSLSMVGHT